MLERRRCLKVFVACSKEDLQEFMRFLTVGGAEVLKKCATDLFVLSDGIILVHL